MLKSLILTGLAPIFPILVLHMPFGQRPMTYAFTHGEISPSSFWAAALKGPMSYAFTHGEISPSSFWAAALKGPMSYAFTHFSFSSCIPPHNLETQIPASRPKSQPRGPISILQAQIPVSRPKSLPPGLNPSPKAQIPALRLKF